MNLLAVNMKTHASKSHNRISCASSWLHPAIFAFCVLGLAILPGCSKKIQTANVLVKVGAREITTDDFEREVQWYQRNGRPLPEKETLLEQLVSRELRLQKARQCRLENDPDVRRAYETMLASKVEERELMPRIAANKVAAEEIRSVYEQEIARYTRPAKVRLAMVFIRTDKKMNDEKLAELRSRIAEARRQAQALPAGSHGFDRVAADYSEDQSSRYKGGDVGWFDQGRSEYRWPSEVVSAGFALSNNGDISDVIKAPDGFYIVSKLETREPLITPMDQVQNAIHRRILTEKREQTQTAFNEQLRASVSIQRYPQVFAMMPYPTTTVAKADEPMPPMLQGTTLSPNAKPRAN